MEKDKLPPIPTPVSQRWREFRIQVIPFIVFIAVVVGIVYLWRTYVQPPGIIGAVDTNSVNVVSLQDGIVQEVFVERFQNVTTGQVVAVVINTDPELLKLQIASVSADLEVTRTKLKVDFERTKQSYEQLIENLNSTEVQQVNDKARLFQLSNDYRRAEELYKSKAYSDAQFDAAKAIYESTASSVTQRDVSISELRRAVQELRPRVIDPNQDPIDAAIEAKRKELEMMLRPVTLKAPIGGMISAIHHLPGERIVRGTAIASISDPLTRRIVAYVRQPITDIPTTNDSVRIITRSLQRQIGIGRVLRVGAQMERIDPAMLSADSRRMEVGLPILVSVPTGLRLVPGEYVNLFLERDRR